MKHSQLSARLIAIVSAVSLALPIVAFAQDEDEPVERFVSIDAPTVARLGVGFGKLEAAQYTAETRGYGQVMPFDALAQTDGELTAAELAVAASEAVLKRAQGLFNANVSVSRQTVEAAERQVASDNAALMLAQRKAIATWGQNLPLRNSMERSALLARLTVGEIALGRVTFPASAVGDGTPPAFSLERVDAGQGGRKWKASTIGPAPADPTVPGRSFYVLIEGARGLVPGERLIANLPMGRP